MVINLICGFKVIFTSVALCVTKPRIRCSSSYYRMHAAFTIPFRSPVYISLTQLRCLSVPRLYLSDAFTMPFRSPFISLCREGRNFTQRLPNSSMQKSLTRTFAKRLPNFGRANHTFLQPADVAEFVYAVSHI